VYWNNDVKSKALGKEHEILLMEDINVDEIVGTPLLFEHGGKDERGRVTENSTRVGNIESARKIGESLWILASVDKEYAHLIVEEGYKALSISYSCQQFANATNGARTSRKKYLETSLVAVPNISDCFVIESIINNSNSKEFFHSSKLSINFPIEITMSNPQEITTTINPTMNPTKQQGDTVGTVNPQGEVATQGTGQKNVAGEESNMDKIIQEKMTTLTPEEQQVALQQYIRNDFINMQSTIAKKTDAVKELTKKHGISDDNIVRSLVENEPIQKFVSDMDTKHQSVVKQYEAELESLKRKIDEVSKDAEKNKKLATEQPQAKVQNVEDVFKSFQSKIGMVTGGNGAKTISPPVISNSTINQPQIIDIPIGKEIVVNNSATKQDGTVQNNTFESVTKESWTRMANSSNLTGEIHKVFMNVKERVKMYAVPHQQFQ
jgi:hypothetical protein